FFFFQAEDGIRYGHVTGVQTCALPICARLLTSASLPRGMEVRISAPPCREVETRSSKGGHAFSDNTRKVDHVTRAGKQGHRGPQIGRASCRERVENSGVEGVSEKEKMR